MIDSFKTTDIYLAATLSSLDYVLEEIIQDGNKFVFRFIKPNTSLPMPIGVDVDQYWTGNLLVDPKRLFSEFKEIKARMYDLKRSTNG